MIPREDFVSILEKKGKPLVEACKATTQTLRSDLLNIHFLSPRLRKIVSSNLHSKFDLSRLEKNKDEIINVMAEIESKLHVIDRKHTEYRSAVLNSYSLCPEDFVRRLKDPDLKIKALADWIFADEFTTCFCFCDGPSMIDKSPEYFEHKDYNLVLINQGILDELDKIIQRNFPDAHDNR